MHPKAPHYPLEDVKDAARKGNFVLRRSAETSSIELGYFENDIKRCLLSLTEKNFDKTIPYEHARYPGQTTECDVYLIDFTHVSERADNLYVKFSFNGWVAVHSFHLQR